MYREKPTQTLTPLYEVQKAAILSHKVKNKNTNPNLTCNLATLCEAGNVYPSGAPEFT
jgi:hypothetical protein